MTERNDDQVFKNNRLTKQHEHAFEVIEQLIDKSVGNDLNLDVLLEVMMVYSVGYNLDHGDGDLMRFLFNRALAELDCDDNSGVEISLDLDGTKTWH